MRAKFFRIMNKTQQERTAVINMMAVILAVKNWLKSDLKIPLI